MWWQRSFLSGSQTIYLVILFWNFAKVWHQEFALTKLEFPESRFFRSSQSIFFSLLVPLRSSCSRPVAQRLLRVVTKLHLWVFKYFELWSVWAGRCDFTWSVIQWKEKCTENSRPKFLFIASLAGCITCSKLFSLCSLCFLICKLGENLT